jgi:3-methyladenine DNA glycosylase/8-oxoguanine DNA glycosylase
MKINTTQFKLKPVTPYHFEYTICSHGWLDLAPFSWDKETKTLHRTHRLASGKVVLLDISGSGTEKKPTVLVDAHHPRTLTKKDQENIEIDVRRMLRMDEDLTEFYNVCNKRGKRWQKLNQGLGRLLRTPSFFEDTIKVIATINMQWGGTKGMIQRLVDVLGDPFPGDPSKKAFPTPQAIAESSMEQFKTEIKMGFRNDYVLTLAKRIVEDDFDFEAFTKSELPTKELKKELQKVKGIGNYAAAILLMSLERYDELAIDSVCRNFAAKKHFKGETPTDDEINKLYDKWGKWKFLAYWFDIWQEYHKK